MSDLKYLDKLLSNKQALLDADWNELLSIQKKYPFSLLINQVLAKKHYFETGYLQSAYFKKSVALQDNPGVAYASMLNWKKKSSLQVEKTVGPVISRKEPQGEAEEILRMEKKHNISEDLYSGISDDFTLWLAGKDKLVREEIEGGKTKPAEKIELKDEIVSESLARIYEKQGLIDEAIEMYKKLSLKNPKKSTYFAGIIENLKNR